MRRFVFVTTVLTIFACSIGCEPTPNSAAMDSSLPFDSDAAQADRDTSDADQVLPTPLLTTDTLEVYPGTVEISEDALICLSLSLLRADGTTVRIAGNGATVVSRNQGVVVPSAPGDCANIGLIGTGTGNTTAEVILTDGEISVRATIRVQIAEPASLRVREYLGAVVGSPIQVAVTGPIGGASPVFRYAARAWTNPDIADVRVFVTGDARRVGLEITGVSAGTSEVFMRYGPPGDEQDVRLGTLRVLPRTTSAYFSTLFFGQAGLHLFPPEWSAEKQSTWAPEGCHAVFGRLIYTVDPQTESATVVRPVTNLTLLSPSATVRETASGVELCSAETSRLEIRACVDEWCQTFAGPVGNPANVSSVVVSPNNVMLNVDGGRCFGCSRLNITATMVDGSSRDLRNDGATWLLNNRVELQSRSADGLTCFSTLVSGEIVTELVYGAEAAPITFHCDL